MIERRSSIYWNTGQSSSRRRWYSTSRLLYITSSIIIATTSVSITGAVPVEQQSTIDTILRNTIDSSLPPNSLLVLLDTNDDTLLYKTTIFNISETNNTEDHVTTTTTIANLLRQQQNVESWNENIERSNNNNNDNIKEERQCRVYFAESTIPNAGWGIFVGVDIQQDEEISIKGDALIPISPLREFSLLNEYTWTGETINNAFAFGMAAIPNCFFPLNNVYLGDDPGNNKLDYNFHYGSYNPGLGATTVYYSDSGGYAWYPMEAGTEIFIDYGYDYFLDERRIRTKFGLIPFEKDYETADVILHRFRNVYNNMVGNIHQCQQQSQKNHDNNMHQEENTSNQQSDVCTKYPYQTSNTINVTTLSYDLYEMTKNVIGLWPTRVQGALPSEVQGINDILDTVGTTAKNYAARSVRSMDYLKEHGSCMDHLYVDDSDIMFAGKGAFANKFLPAGSVVAPVPLLHIPRSVLKTYNNNIFDDFNDQLIEHYQLLLNYCFGHKEMSIVLCPYGIASSVVNHPGEYQEANVKLVWSNKLMQDPQWLNTPLREWKNEFHGGLAFDYVALRDIEQDEEILFDYGIEWQEAWDEHVKYYPSTTHFKYHLLNSYEPPISLPRYNEEDNPLVWALSYGDSDFQPYLWCRSITLVFHDGYDINHYTPNNNMPIYYPCRIIDKKLIDERFQEYTYTAELIDRKMKVRQLVEPFTGSDSEEYNDNTAAAGTSEVYHEICTEWNGERVLFNVDRDTFLFGSIDMDEYNPVYLESWTFRHDIRIPDEIMPELWKDLKQ